MPTVLHELAERSALKYAGDCKCGNCRLVPAQLLTDATVELAQLRALLNRVVVRADGGHWRDGTGLSFAAHPLVDEIRARINPDASRN